MEGVEHREIDTLDHPLHGREGLPAKERRARQYERLIQRGRRHAADRRGRGHATTPARCAAKLDPVAGERLRTRDRHRALSIVGCDTVPRSPTKESIHDTDMGGWSKEKRPLTEPLLRSIFVVPADSMECVLTVSARPSVMSAHAIALNLCQETVNRQSQVMSNITLALRCNTSSPDADISSNTAQVTPDRALLWYARTRRT
jgi:hypothetical protein